MSINTESCIGFGCFVVICLVPELSRMLSRKKMCDNLCSDKVDENITTLSIDLKMTIPRQQHSYRIDEEGGMMQRLSSEYTRRGQLWSKHASWHLPCAPREIVVKQEGIEHVVNLLRKFDVDPQRGFLPLQDPLQRLPYTRYHLWEGIYFCGALFL